MNTANQTLTNNKVINQSEKSICTDQPIREEYSSPGRSLTVQTEARPLQNLSQVVRTGDISEQSCSGNLVTCVITTPQTLEYCVRLNIDDHPGDEDDDAGDGDDDVETAHVGEADNKVGLEDAIPEGEQEC